MIWKSWGLGGRVLPNGNIMNKLFVFFEVACLLCLVGASVLITVVPTDVDIMNVLFVFF